MVGARCPVQEVLARQLATFAAMSMQPVAMLQWRQSQAEPGKQTVEGAGGLTTGHRHESPSPDACCPVNALHLNLLLHIVLAGFQAL